MKPVIFMGKLTAICSLIMLFGIGSAGAGSWTSLEYPGASITCPYAISGNNIVGWYDAPDINHGFLYNGTTWTSLDPPDVSLIYASGTRIQGISGNKLVGSYINTSGVTKGCIYDLVSHTWAVLPITASAIDGIYVIGGNHQIYNLTTKVLATITIPSQFSRNNVFAGISGNNIVGKYSSIDTRGFIFNLNMQSWTSINKPGALLTNAHGIDGSNVVGCYYDSYGMHGFIYNINTQDWTTLDVPGASLIYLCSISGGRIVGYYEDAYGDHAFLYTFSIAADINADGKIDMLDYAMLASQWQKAPGVPSADIAPSGGDGIVDSKDLAVMVGNWLEGV